MHLPFDPLLLALLALLCGVLACVSAVFSTRQERRHLERLPEHHVKLEVDGSATLALSVRSSAASSEELAHRIQHLLNRAL